MGVEFGGQLFETESARCRCIAMEWLTAGGLNDADVIDAWLDELSPTDLADEAFSGWFERDDDDTPPPDIRDLIMAFHELRDHREWLRR